MDGALIYVTWNETTIDKLGSFFIYKISASPTSNSRSRQSVGGPIIKLVLSNETSTTLNVDNNVEYYVSVIYVTLNSKGIEIEGPSSPLITIPSNNCYMYYCLSFKFSYINCSLQ